MKEKKNPEEYYMVNPPSELIPFYKDRLKRFVDNNLHVPVLMYIKNHPNLPTVKIAENLSKLIYQMSQAHVHKAIVELQEMGFIFQSRVGTKKVPVYSITDEGNEYILKNWDFMTKKLDFLDRIKEMVNH